MPGNTSTDIWIAGAAAAFTVDLIVYPLDTIKTRIQSPDYNRLYLDEATNVVKRGALFRGLYQGVGSVILATLPSSGAFFTTYEGTKTLLSKHNPSFSNGAPMLPTPIIHSLSSGLAELVSCAILTPAEVIKQNAQMVTPTTSSSSNQPSTSATLQTISRFRHHPLALWRGYTILASRNLPFTALQFPIFERFKSTLLAYRREKRLRNGKSDTKAPLTIFETAYITGFAAGGAGSIAAVVTTPIDVVKTRIMLSAATSFAEQAATPGKLVDATGAAPQERSSSSTSSSTSSSSTSKPQKIPDGRKTSMQIGREIIAEQGWKGLWRGGALRAAWTVLGSGLYLGAYEAGKLYLERGRE